MSNSVKYRASKLGARSNGSQKKKKKKKKKKPSYHFSRKRKGEIREGKAVDTHDVVPDEGARV
jgi:hypothetical protein